MIYRSNSWIYRFFIVLQNFVKSKKVLNLQHFFFCIAKISWNWNMLWNFRLVFLILQKIRQIKECFESFCSGKISSNQSLILCSAKISWNQGTRSVGIHPLIFHNFLKISWNQIMLWYILLYDLQNFVKSKNESNLKILVIVKIKIALVCCRKLGVFYHLILALCCC